MQPAMKFSRKLLKMTDLLLQRIEIWRRMHDLLSAGVRYLLSRETDDVVVGNRYLAVQNVLHAHVRLSSLAHSRRSACK